jgi:hypothetical protein
MERKRFDASDKQNKRQRQPGWLRLRLRGCVLSERRTARAVWLLRAAIVHTDGRSARTGVCRQPVRGTARRARATSRGHPAQQPSGAG